MKWWKKLRNERVDEWKTEKSDVHSFNNMVSFAQQDTDVSV